MSLEVFRVFTKKLTQTLMIYVENSACVAFMYELLHLKYAAINIK